MVDTMLTDDLIRSASTLKRWRLWCGLLLVGIPLVLAGCGGEVATNAPEADADDSAAVDDANDDSTPPQPLPDKQQPAEAPQEAPAGQLTSEEFLQRMASDADGMLGKTWEVRGFLNYDGSAFRTPSTSRQINYLEFAAPLDAAERHSRREVTLRGVADKRGENPLLKNCTVATLGPHPDEIVVDATKLYEAWAADPRYEELRLVRDSLSSEGPHVKVSGVVLNVTEKGSIAPTVYLTAGPDAVLGFELSGEVDSPLPEIHRGAAATFEARFEDLAAADSKRLRFYDARLVKEESPPASPSPANVNVHDVTAEALLKDAESGSEVLEKKLAVVTFATPGGDRTVPKPILVRGVVKEIQPASEVFQRGATVVLSVSESDATVNCEMMPGEPLDDVSAGNEVAIIGTYSLTLSTGGSVQLVELKFCRVQRTPAGEP